MKASLIQFFAATTDGTSIHIVHGLEQSRIEFNGIVGFRERKFGYGGIKLQLQALQEDRMIYAPFGTGPAQKAISEDKFDAFRLAIDASVQRIKCLEYFHASASRLFLFCPLISQELPALK